MTEVREYKVTVLEDATKEDMIKSQYRLHEIGNEEWNVHDECGLIDKKLQKIDEWKRFKCKCGCGYKNRRR